MLGHLAYLLSIATCAVPEANRSFTESGLELSGGGWTLQLALDAWGRPGATSPAPPAGPGRRNGRIEYDRGALTEWYVEDPLRGLEQGFTIEAAPGGEGPLRLRLSVGRSGFRTEVLPGGRDARFVELTGESSEIL